MSQNETLIEVVNWDRWFRWYLNYYHHEFINEAQEISSFAIYLISRGTNDDSQPIGQYWFLLEGVILEATLDEHDVQGVRQPSLITQPQKRRPGGVEAVILASKSKGNNKRRDQILRKIDPWQNTAQTGIEALAFAIKFQRAVIGDKNPRTAWYELKRGVWSTSSVCPFWIRINPNTKINFNNQPGVTSWSLQMQTVREFWHLRIPSKAGYAFEFFNLFWYQHLFVAHVGFHNLVDCRDSFV